MQSDWRLSGPTHFQFSANTNGPEIAFGCFPRIFDNTLSSEMSSMFGGSWFEIKFTNSAIQVNLRAPGTSVVVTSAVTTTISSTTNNF